jgi:PAS domain S-box-containing protein
VPSTDRGLAFCAHAIKRGPDTVMVVKDARRDPLFKANPLVTGEPHIRFYAGAVLTTPQGHNLGTLCVIDDKPRPQPSQSDLDTLRTLAKMVVDEIELRRAKREAEETARVLQMAKQIAGFGRWRMDLTTGKSVWSDAAFAIYGLDPRKVEPGLKCIMSLCEPDQRGKLLAAVEAAIATKTGYEVELKIRWPNGEIRHVKPKGVCELDAAGTPVALVGVVQDVTERVNTLKALEDYACRAELAQQVAGLGHWRVDAGTRKITWSTQMYAIYGLEPDNAIDMDAIQAMTDPEDWAANAAALERLLTTGKSAGQDITRIRRANGELRYVRSNAAAELGPDGSVLAAVGALLDITDLMQAELALARSEARYKLLAENAKTFILRSDASGRITHAAPWALDLNGHAPEDLIGRLWSEFVVAPYEEPVRAVG